MPYCHLSKSVRESMCRQNTTIQKCHLLEVVKSIHNLVICYVPFNCAILHGRSNYDVNALVNNIFAEIYLVSLKALSSQRIIV